MKSPSSQRIDRFDYVGAYAQILRELRRSPSNGSCLTVLADLCSRIASGHGLSLDKETGANSKVAGIRTLDIILPHLLAQLAEEGEDEQNSVPQNVPLFKVEHGWEADVYLSQRRSYLNSVIKIYRRHCLGGNPRYPGFGWIIDQEEIEKIHSVGKPLPTLPEKLFTPADSIEKLLPRFYAFSALSFYARILKIWTIDDRLCLEQERVIPLREFGPSEIFYATSLFLTQCCGVYFNNPVVETAVILHHGQYYLLQDYINNLAYRFDTHGKPDRNRPAIFDGNIFPITPRYLEAFPSLAQAVLLISRLYPEARQDRAMIKVAKMAAAGAVILDPAAPPHAILDPSAPEAVSRMH